MENQVLDQEQEQGCFGAGKKWSFKSKSTVVSTVRRTPLPEYSPQYTHTTCAASSTAMRAFSSLCRTATQSTHLVQGEKMLFVLLKKIHHKEILYQLYPNNSIWK